MAGEVLIQWQKPNIPFLLSVIQSYYWKQRSSNSKLQHEVMNMTLV